MAKHTEIKLYGDIGFTNTGNDFTNRLAELEKQYTHLTIHLHSGGGCVFEGNVIYNAIQNSKLHVKIIIDGIAASMASIILLAANEVEICENAFIMIHRPTISSGGNVDEIKQQAKLLNDMENNFAKCYATKTGLSKKEVTDKWFDGKDHWLNADEAVKLGFANRKIKPLANDVKILDISDVSKMNINNIYQKYAAKLNNKNNNIMKQLLIETFKLEGVTAESPDEEIIEKLQEKFEQSQTETKEAVASLVKKAVTDGKIKASMQATYQGIGEKNGIATLVSLFNEKTTNNAPFLITDLIQSDTSHKTRKDWTLEDYRMYAPHELRNNPKLYAELAAKQYGNNND